MKARSRCGFCGLPLPGGPPWVPEGPFRLAYDPLKGRLWLICPGCRRWNLAPLEERWETLAALEEAGRERGRLLLTTGELSLLAVDRGELVRVGAAARPEWVDWRYGPRLPDPGPRKGFWWRILSRLPPPPEEGYDPYRSALGTLRRREWLGSPFLEAASLLTRLFSELPLAPTCPACRGPLALHPWRFQSLRFVHLNAGPALEAPCALCGSLVTVDPAEARPSLRLGLFVVTSPEGLMASARGAARALEGVGGGAGFLALLGRERTALGELGEEGRAGLVVALDEMAEAAALLAEWRVAEEVAAIADGELTEVPGFEAFRRKVLGGETA